jgi:Tripartite tricarboxylate transporter family receptor
MFGNFAVLTKFKLLVLALLLFNPAQAQETIIISNAAGPSHSGTPHILAMIDLANRMQKKYHFVQEFRTGAFESLSHRHILSAPNQYLTVMSNASAESVDRGLIDLDNYVPVFSQGDSCWMVIGLTGPDKDLSAVKNLKEIVVGTPAIGGATHLAALEIGRKYNVPVRMVVFKSNFDAFVNMAANNGINFSVERVANYQQYKVKNPNMQVLAAQCPTRHPSMPEIKTLEEYGISTPYIWQQLVASKNMDPARRKEIAKIITKAELALGRERILQISDHIPPLFVGKTTEQHYQDSWNRLRYQRVKWQEVLRNP